MYYKTFSQRYSDAFRAFRGYGFPWRLVGMNLLSVVLMYRAVFSPTAAFLWIASIIANACVSAGISLAHLKAYRGEEYNLMDAFSVFKDFNTLKRVGAGMGWMHLLVALWSVIPFMALYAGGLFVVWLGVALSQGRNVILLFMYVFVLIVAGIAASILAAVKSIEYSFTPYILMTRPGIKATEAVKESSRMTKGIRGKIFAALVVPVILFCIVVVVLMLLSTIQILGILFAFALILIYAAFIIFYPTLARLVLAGFYDDALNLPPTPPYYYNQYNQPLSPQTPPPTEKPQEPSEENKQ